MLLQRVLIPLGLQHGQRLNQFLAGLAGLDDGIDVASLCRHVGIGKALAKLFNLFLPDRFAILGLLQFSLVHNIDCAFRPHHRDLCRRPGIIHIRSDVF